jgi:hypothetical protein
VIFTLISHPFIFLPLSVSGLQSSTFCSLLQVETDMVSTPPSSTCRRSLVSEFNNNTKFSEVPMALARPDRTGEINEKTPGSSGL